MKKRAILFLIFIFALISPICAYSDASNDVVNQIASGSINWTKGVITAKGIGAAPEKYYGKPQARPMALRAALVVARRNLLEAIKGVRIDSKTLVKNFIVDSDIIKSEVSGIVKNSKIVKKEYMSDGTVEVIVQIGLPGDFAKAIYRKEIPKPKYVPEKPKQIQRSPNRLVNQMQKETKSKGFVYTGLVIDARKIRAKAAMAPKIMDENGKELYGTAVVDREYAIKQGMSGYSKDLNAAQTNLRVTNKPLTVKGIKRQGAGGSNIVISNQDAEKLRAATDMSFLKKCRVIIVVD